MRTLHREEFLALAAIAEREAGLHLPDSKRAFVEARLQRRLRRCGYESFGAYSDLVRSDAPGGMHERQMMISALTTNVTHLFREPHHFSLLADHFRSWLTTLGPRNRRYLVWSAGCSTGEEPLSIAATLHGVLGRDWSSHADVLATDVDHAVLDIARHRGSDLEIVASLRGQVSGADRSVLCDRGARAFLRNLTDSITYLHHNLLHPLDVPGQFNAIFCRNVTIYFSETTRARVHERIAARLAPGGLLAIGHSERLPGACGFATVGRTAYRDDHGSIRRSAVDGIGEPGCP